MQSQEKSKLGRKTKVFAVVIIAVAVILAVSSVWDDSIIVDEVPHIGAGYSYLVKQDMRLNPEHPPLAKDLAAIPLLFLKLSGSITERLNLYEVEPLSNGIFDTKFWKEDINGQWNFGRRLIYNSGNDADLIKHLVKLPMLLFFILSAILIFKWGRRLYGDLGAIIALVLFSFSSTVIAHSRFVTTDMPALFGVLLATYYFVQYLKTPSRKNLFIASLTFGIALLLKFSTFLLVPFFIFLALIYGFIKNPRPADAQAPWIFTKVKDATWLAGKTILIFIIGFIIIVWPVYYFHTYNYPPERQHRDTQQLLSSYGNRKFADPVVWASDKPVLRAAAQYGLGLLMVNQRAVGGNTTYFLGEVSRFGWRKYFPIVYFIKEPLAWWGMVVVALLFAAQQWRYRLKEWPNRGYHLVRKYPEEFAMLLWLAIYWGASIKGTLNIGVRHLLPVYPFTILLVSRQIAKILEVRSKNYKVSKIKRLILNSKFLILALLAWYIVENIRVYPYYLTYFNQTVGGPSGGYKYVVDSNLDWGQDLVRFNNWVKENNIPKIEFDYFGWADPSYYLKDRYVWMSSTKYKDGRDFAERNQSDGWLAVSATFLMGSQGPYDQPKSPNYLWLNFHQPVTTIGNSIFIYRIK